MPSIPSVSVLRHRNGTGGRRRAPIPTARMPPLPSPKGRPGLDPRSSCSPRLARLKLVPSGAAACLPRLVLLLSRVKRLAGAGAAPAGGAIACPAPPPTRAASCHSKERRLDLPSAPARAWKRGGRRLHVRPRHGMAQRASAAGPPRLPGGCPSRSGAAAGKLRRTWRPCRGHAWTSACSAARCSTCAAWGSEPLRAAPPPATRGCWRSRCRCCPPLTPLGCASWCAPRRGWGPASAAGSCERGATPRSGACPGGQPRHLGARGGVWVGSALERRLEHAPARPACAPASPHWQLYALRCLAASCVRAAPSALP
jgi:hypothetical protein